MSAIVRINAHGGGAGGAPAARIVISRLARGESLVGGGLPAVKMVLEGEEVHRIDGRSYRLRPGQMLLVGRGEPYEAGVRRGEAKGICVYLPVPPGDGPQAPLLGRVLLHPAATPLGRRLAQLGLALHRGRGGNVDVGAVLDELAWACGAAASEAARGMSMLAAQKPATRHEIYNRLETARAHLHGHADRTVPLGELAKVAGLSAFHLARSFSAAFGTPPAAYHRRVRLERAAEALRTGTISVTDASALAGYGELSAFSTAFRRVFGVPPSAIA